MVRALSSALLLTVACSSDAPPSGASHDRQRVVAIATVAPAPPPPKPTYPRLGEQGFEGLSATAMASPAALRQRFQGAAVDAHDGWIGMIDRDGAEIARVELAPDASTAVIGDRVSLRTPSMETSHGLRVGDPLRNVLDVHVRHWCETSAAGTESQVRVFVRCWVGDKPARFRYVSFITDESLAPPRDGKALDRWIASSKQRIDLVLWHRTPEPGGP
jgi:hypothetical protein